MKSRRLAQLSEALSLLDDSQIINAIRVLKQACERGSFVWLVGNGGSAATASHFANDLLKMCAIKAVDISGMTPVTLAFGNDHGWDRMFSSVIHALASEGDVIVLVSCSGNSPNILRVADSLAYIQEKYPLIILTGNGDGKLSGLPCSAHIEVMAEDITVQEDMHSIVCHEIAWSIAHG